MIDRLTDEKIICWIDDNKNEILEKWINLAKIPSIRSEALPGAPFGANCKKALDYSAEIFSEKGFTCENRSDRGYALAYYGNQGKTIGLFCHSDVVPVGDGWLYTKPFEPVIKNGALIGRGVEDNKSGIIASFCLYKFLKDNNIVLNNRLQTFIGSDEECGMQDLENYLEDKNAVPDMSIVPDADFPCSVGEKGIYHFLAGSDEMFCDVVDFYGGEAYNIVLDNVTVKIRHNPELEREIKALIENKNEFELSCDEGLLIFRAKGIAKHASIPDGSVNAALIASRLLSGCESLNICDRKIFAAISDILSSDYGHGIGVVHDDENFGRMTSVNGLCKTVDKKPFISFDVRYGSTLDAEYLEKTTEKVLSDKGFTVVEKDNSPGFAIDKDSELPEIFEQIYEDITGESKKRVLMSGGTYARKLKNAFSVGTFAFENGKNSSFLMPDGHGGAHQCDEMIDIEGFFTALRILIHSVIECDKKL